jgi:hypothetical protein
VVELVATYILILSKTGVPLNSNAGALPPDTLKTPADERDAEVTLPPTLKRIPPVELTFCIRSWFALLESPVPNKNKPPEFD